MHQDQDPTTENPSRGSNLLRWLPIVLVVSVFLLLIVRRAWLCDDAYITFRTIDNFISGYRPTWNINERVQAFTHPLWMLLLSFFYYLTREIYLTSIFLSLAISLAVVVIFAARVSKSTLGAVLGIAVLGLSNAFVDYSTSGLENPLTHLILVIFFALYCSGKKPTARRLFWASFLVSLAGVNRPDTLLLYVLPLLYLLWELPDKRRGLLVLALGQTPLLIWLAFSTVYYGFPFPNTAYAKLGHGVPDSKILRQGFYYLLNSWQRDPITLTAIITGILVTGFRRNKSTAVGLGIVLYLLYVVKIGGDFMSGRFLSAPLLCAMAIIANIKPVLLHRREAWGLLPIAVLIGLLAPLPTYRVHQARFIDAHGIADEREFYYNSTGLLRNREFNTQPHHEGVLRGQAARKEAEEAGDRKVIYAGSLGFQGYYAGPMVHIIDHFGLGDPLLARLPSVRYPTWRMGHFERTVPQGYISSCYTTRNLIENPQLNEYYEALNLIVRGKLFSSERLSAIWKMNTGQYDHLVEADTYRYPKSIDITFNEKIKPENGITFTYSGLTINYKEPQIVDMLYIEMGSGIDYELIYYLRTKTLAAQSIKTISETVNPEIKELQRVQVPEAARRDGFDKIRIFPLTEMEDGHENNQYRLWRFEMIENYFEPPS
jgi:arabinofuranosyltransferase